MFQVAGGLENENLIYADFPLNENFNKTGVN